ncbi:hypothetical protein BBBOND_0307270 [Babesia bigemina]|uniref:Uncharacterized protein n=1 Tax=Babesia bigemina TaxID=5866 RepID=A0A061D8J2_BABBI|nr:hypothetical protein BBBOND_0307270 [Babesia bigemina]CDR96823.1 hypothetical protein BBBOND_0307270 [Babesia bigemina]|eukprot:XP_012769009.1 hypothetical protein BBBOND_0307270 [Babesia bigemina]
MNVIRAAAALLMFLAGFTYADGDAQRRQQCIDKCVTKHKTKVMRPMHRLLCKISCRARHGAKIEESLVYVHPAYNGKDALFQS